MAKSSKIIIKPNAPLTETGQAIPIGKPIMDRAEKERAEKSLKVYYLSPEELAAYNEKHGKPTRKLNANRAPGVGMAINRPSKVRPKGGKGA